MNKIDEVIMELISEMVPNEDGLYWWNPTKLMRYAEDCPVWICSGERRVGKTYFNQKLMFRLWEKYGWTSGWIRNQKIEYDNPTFRTSFLDTPLKEGWIDDTWTIDTEGLHAPNPDNPKRPGPTVIKFFALSTASNTRGGSHHDTHFLFMDEIEREDGKVMKNGKTALLSLSKTVLSGKKDVRIILASNAIHLTNQMYLGFRIYPDSKFDVTAYHDKGVAIEAVRKGKYHTQSDDNDPLAKVYRAGGYGDYAYTDEVDIAKLIKKVPKGAKMGNWGYKVDGEYYLYWVHNHLWYFAPLPKGHTIPSGTFFMTPNITEVDDHTEKAWPFVIRDLKDMIGGGMCRFNDPNTMMVFVAMAYGVQV